MTSIGVRASTGQHEPRRRWVSRVNFGGREMISEDSSQEAPAEKNQDEFAWELSKVRLLQHGSRSPPRFFSAHTHTCGGAHARPRAHGKQTHTHTHTHARTHARTSTHKRARAHTSTHQHTCTTETHTRTHNHNHIHIHTHTQENVQPLKKGRNTKKLQRVFGGAPPGLASTQPPALSRDAMLGACHSHPPTH